MQGKAENLDVIIIGGGPGGLSAALWAADLGLRAILIEKENELGGQLLWTYNKIRNYLGCEADDGRSLADRFIEHVDKVKVDVITGCEVVAADLVSKIVKLADGRRFTSSSIVIAAGVTRRKLGVRGENQLAGRGILESGIKSRDEVAGKTVIIVGGGDAALENALILSGSAQKVIVVHRREQFAARDEFVERTRLIPNIEVVLNSVVTAINGDRALEGVDVANIVSAERSSLAADKLLVRIGVIPNSALFRDQIELDPDGYVVVDQDFQTSQRGVFAIGDIADPRSPTINMAVGAGARAIKTISFQCKKRTKI